MSKSMRYAVLFIALLVLTGCETLHGAATGFGQDVHNISNPDKNGWNSLKKADTWVQEHLW